MTLTPEALAAYVESIVPATRTNAVVATVDDDGVALVLKMTRGEHWEIDAAFRRDWTGDLSVGARVIYSW